MYSGRIKKCEIPHFPLPVFGRFCSHGIFFGNPVSLKLRPPSVYVFHQQVHLKVFRKFLNVEVLQQKGRKSMLAMRAVMKEGKTSVAPAQRKANVLIKLLR